MNENIKMKIGDLVEKTGIPRHRIHYYINQGVLHPPEKVNRTTAYYDESHLKRLKVISRVKREYHSPLAFITSQFEGSVRPNPPIWETPPEGEKVKKKPLNEKKKLKFIQAAIEIMPVRGYHNTSIKDITDHLGFSTATFYLYFKSKRDLFFEAAAWAVKNTVDEMEAEVEGEKDFFLRNTRRLEILKEHYPKFNEILTQLRAQTHDPEATGPSLSEVYYELSRPFIREIREAVGAGISRRVDPDLLVFSLIGMCDALLMRLSLDDRYNLNQIIEFIFNVMINGLKPDQAA